MPESKGRKTFFPYLFGDQELQVRPAGCVIDGLEVEPGWNTDTLELDLAQQDAWTSGSLTFEITSPDGWVTDYVTPAERDAPPRSGPRR